MLTEGGAVRRERKILNLLFSDLRREEEGSVLIMPVNGTEIPDVMPDNEQQQNDVSHLHSANTAYAQSTDIQQIAFGGSFIPSTAYFL